MRPGLFQMRQPMRVAGDMPRKTHAGAERRMGSHTSLHDAETVAAICEDTDHGTGEIRRPAKPAQHPVGAQFTPRQLGHYPDRIHVRRQTMLLICRAL